MGTCQKSTVGEVEWKYGKGHQFFKTPKMEEWAASGEGRSNLCLSLLAHGIFTTDIKQKVVLYLVSSGLASQRWRVRFPYEGRIFVKCWRGEYVHA